MKWIAALARVFERNPLSTRSYLLLWGLLALLQICLGLTLWRLLPDFPDRYSDLVVSHLTLIGGDKRSDFVFLFLLLFWSAEAGDIVPSVPLPATRFCASCETALTLGLSLATPLLLARLLSSWWGGLGLGIACLLAIAAIVASYCWRAPRDIASHLLALQCLSPLLFLRVLRFDFVQSGTITTYRASGIGAACVIAVALALALHAWRQLRARPLADATLFALAFFSVWPRSQASPFFLDDYHTGEMIVPLQQFLNHGQRAYADFVNNHGGLALVYGLWNKFLYQDTYATAQFAIAGVRATMAAIWCWAAINLLRGAPAWCLVALSLFLIPGWDRYLFIPLLLVWLGRPGYNGWKRDWPYLLLALAALCFLSAASGIAAVMALLPFFVWQVCGGARIDSRGGARIDGRGIAALVVGALFAARYGPGFLQFVAENGNGTQEAFGLSLREHQALPAFLDHVSSGWIHSALEHVASFLKLYGWVFALWLVALFWRSPPGNAIRFLLERGRMFTLFACVGFVLVPYTYGRIGTDGLARIGYFGLIYIGLLLPLEAWQWNLRARLPLAFAAILLFALQYRALSFVHDFSSPWATFGKVAAPESLRRAPALESELPGLGEALLDPDTELELASFASGWNWLGHGTYLDFTNRQNHYYLSRTAVPQLYPSLFMAINAEIQNRVVETIRRTRAAGAWIAKQHDHEAVTISVRAYRVFRWLVEEAPVSAHWHEGEAEFVRFDWSANRADPEAREAMLPAFAQISRGWEHFPTIWGDNWTTLAPRFRALPKQAYAIGSELAIPARLGTGERADFLLLESTQPLESEKYALEVVGANGKVLQAISFFGSSAERWLIPVGALAMSWSREAASVRVAGESPAGGELTTTWLRLSDGEPVAGIRQE